MKIRKIIIIVGIISSIVSIVTFVIGIFYLLDEAQIVDMEKLLESEEDEDSSDFVSPSAEGILEIAQKIKEYIAERKWVWSSDIDHFNMPRYNSGSNTKTCCATYVAYVLKELGMMDENTVINDVGTFDNFLSARPSEWKKLSISNYSQLNPGDICIHKSKQNRSLVYTSDILIYMGEISFFGLLEARMLFKIQGELPLAYLIRHIDIVNKICNRMYNYLKGTDFIMGKKKVEKILIILSIIIAIMIAIIVYLVKNGAKLPNVEKDKSSFTNVNNSIIEENYTENTLMGNYLEWAMPPGETEYDIWKEEKISEEDIKLKQVDDIYIYFLIKQCLQNYYNPENTNRAMNILDNGAKKDLGITNNNVTNLYNNKVGVDFCIDKIYEQRVNTEDSSQKLYVVYHRIGTGSTKTDTVVFIKIEERNVTFSVYPYEYLQKHNYLNLEQGNRVTVNNEEILQNDNNMYKVNDFSTNNISCIRELYNRYKFDIQYDVQGLYNKLNEEYKNIKFPNYENFLEYISDTKQEALNQDVEKYRIEKDGQYNEYTILCGEKNYYVFYAKNIMEYTVSLDIYSAESLIYTNAYKSAFPKGQGEYCIDRIIKAINDKNYEFVYSKLNPVQKGNYYSNFEDFKNYIASSFYEKNNYEVQESLIKVSSRTYQYNVKITDANTDNPQDYRNFIMAITLKENTDFYISITK